MAACTDEADEPVLEQLKELRISGTGMERGKIAGDWQKMVGMAANSDVPMMKKYANDRKKGCTGS